MPIDQAALEQLFILIQVIQPILSFLGGAFGQVLQLLFLGLDLGTFLFGFL
ncbi:MAG: hypothetical protein AMXMBFR84_35640 [Candidatus Hydrogenedentota bacterium]